MTARDRAPPDLLQQARALRAAIRRQTSPSIVELLRGEAERLEALADEFRLSARSRGQSARGGGLRG